jgi:hypothetical protein
LAGGANQQGAAGNVAGGEPAGMNAVASAQGGAKGAAGAAAMSGGGSSAGSPATTAGSSTASGGAAAQGTMGSDPPEASGNQMLEVVATASPNIAEDSLGFRQNDQKSGPGDIPIRRTIHIVVRSDRIAILPESQANTPPANGGNVIRLEGQTPENLDKVVTAISEHVSSWGTAGQGLYWRPVILVNVGPDGARRADELATLLRSSGIEFRFAAQVNPRRTTR